MPSYSCDVCNFSSSLSANYKRHLKTKKHLINEENLRVETEKKNKIPSNLLQNPPKLEEIPPKPSKNPPKTLQNDPILSEKLKKTANFGEIDTDFEKIQIDSKVIQSNSKNPESPILSDSHFEFESESESKKNMQNSKLIYICEHCGKEFSRKDNLKRHMNTRCKVNNNAQKVDYKEMFYFVKEELQKEKQEFKKQISMLLEKVGNTTNNITNTQNIQLNSYGSEDLSHITDTLKSELLKVPYGMIPKMIEAVHFNDSKPENKNIALTNKKDNKIMVFKNNKWVYCNKDETINDLVDGKYFILDNHYQKLENDVSFSEDTKTTYEKFKTFYDEGDKKVVDQLKKDCELILLNNR